eukprot:CAMPEP_0184368134 /NCGR_PEP_ID=MMETSP1089-20130417/161451_1 /TAXON_ID=38269 ORGANISM="Gloeochaete wittrockiana, Strain SAG46.84" /NCGR_SAMPLE_ID=MMETSP1089 /ASSEMBLY_ACC=CAM_ASM_000445 /LENGTH=53 /DNA_ID=CAMNT_0026710335 /DNA_START=14 /DNA_END=175 /DNA_ORIENTATION=-
MGLWGRAALVAHERASSTSCVRMFMCDDTSTSSSMASSSSVPSSANIIALSKA